MILIITHKEDYTADFVIDKLNKQSIKYYRFNCEDYLNTNLTINLGGIEKFSIEENNCFSSIWYRRTKLPDIDCVNASEKRYLLNEIDIFLQDLFGVLNSRWLSKPHAVSNAENKLLQLSLAKEIGFTLPRTLLTTDKNELKGFLSKNSNTIIKPIGRGRIQYSENKAKLIFTSLIGQEVIAEIDSLELTPAIYQEYIEKEYELRVTVVGKDIFTSSVNSQNLDETKVDWRRKKVKFEQCEMPTSLKEKCLLLMQKLDISFGAFDFIKGKDGEYYFLEVNPNGQWVWVEKDTGLPISDSIIKFLTHE